MSKFDVAIIYLAHTRNHLKPGTDTDSCNAAIRVLEAAGKVDKERAVKYMSIIGVGAYETDADSTFYPPNKQAVAIRALLAALLDETGKEVEDE